MILMLLIGCAHQKDEVALNILDMQKGLNLSADHLRVFYQLKLAQGWKR
jgi:hypothetical protein